MPALLPAQVQVADRHIELLLAAGDEQVVRQVFEIGLFGPVPTSPAGRPIVVDLGAHVGAFTFLLAASWPQASIFAFESHPVRVQLLRRNAVRWPAVQVYDTLDERLLQVWDAERWTDIALLKVSLSQRTIAILDRLGERVLTPRHIVIEYESQAQRRDIDARLTGHALVQVRSVSQTHGVATYVRTDL